MIITNVSPLMFSIYYQYEFFYLIDSYLDTIIKFLFMQTCPFEKQGHPSILEPCNS